MKKRENKNRLATGKKDFGSSPSERGYIREPVPPAKITA